VLVGHRVAQACQAKLCRGQARPQNHNERFPQYQATQAGTFEKIRCQLQTSWAECGSVGLAELQNQNKRFWVYVVFRRREVCLFFVAAVSVSVLAGQRVAQAKLGRGQARPRNHNKRFPQYQVTQAGTFEKIS
jgi:hypothetical protein